MDQCSPTDRNHFERHQLAAWEAVAHARVDDTQLAGYWKHWKKHCQKTCTHKYLLHLEKPQQQEVLIVFDSRVRAGEFGHGKEVRVGSVYVALRELVQTIIMVGHPEMRRTYNKKELDPPSHGRLAA